MRALVLENAVPEIPLQLGAGVVGFEAVHDVVAAGEDQVGLVGELLHVVQAGSHALAGAELRLDVDVGEMADAEGAVARGRRRIGGERRARRRAPGEQAGGGRADGDHRITASEACC